jgi:hypothetical protein
MTPESPLPDRVRPLEGAGMVNLYGDMGYSRRSQFRVWLWPGLAACIGAAVICLVGLGVI